MTGDGGAVMDRREFVRGAGALAAAGVISTSIPARALAGVARSKAGRSVAVFGGGPAGMTVAHELAERGFRVELYERHAVLGGKVRSVRQAGTGVGGRPDVPLNSGGHFFSMLYPNVGDTLARIPSERGTVLDHLTTGRDGMSVLLGWGGGALPIPVPSRARFPKPVTPQMIVQLLLGAPKAARMLTLQDEAVLGSKLLALVASGPKRQWGELEHLWITDYLRPDRLSAGGRKVAELDGQIDRYFNARVMQRVLDAAVDGVLGATGSGISELLCMLDGPETEVWFDPWARYLRGLGVRFRMRQTLAGLKCRGRIVAASVVDHRGRRRRVEADHYVVAAPCERVSPLLNRGLLAADPSLEGIGRLRNYGGIALQLLLKRKVPELGTLFATLDAPWQVISEVLTSQWTTDLSRCGDGTAVELVAVQVADDSAFRRPGMLYGKPANECTKTELINEILAQWRRYLPGGGEIFADANIHSWQVTGRRVAATARGLATDEPLFAASPGCWQDQPEQATAIPNLFLAGSYTRTSTIACNMDGANESGKLAANAVLEASGVSVAPIKLGTVPTPPALQALRAEDDVNYALGLPNVFDVVAPGPGPAAGLGRAA
jgi:uncharacterized protein with NAD-binding domain and iron-sulfur cluster